MHYILTQIKLIVNKYSILMLLNENNVKKKIHF